jgi:hypothetical protein
LQEAKSASQLSPIRIIRPSISSMTASVIGFERSSSARSLHAASQRSIQRVVARADRVSETPAAIRQDIGFAAVDL